MSRDYRQISRTRRNAPVEVRREYGPLAMPLSYFLVVWLACAVLAGFSWDNLITNTPGAVSFGVTARIVLAVSFGLPGAGLVSLLVEHYSRQVERTDGRRT